MKEAIKVIFHELLNARRSMGMGATQSKYQKFPFKPLAMYQHKPDTKIAVIVRSGVAEAEVAW